jgi:cephalosporin-C deacetylase-like acetyl esterase
MMATRLLAVSVILLFISVIVAPSINQRLVNAFNADDSLETTTEKPFSSPGTKRGDIESMNITFESNNYTLYGVIFYPSEQSETYPGIVFCEGLAGYVEAYSWIPQALAAQGYVVLLYDYPGQGRSEGFLGQRNISIPALNFFFRFSAIFEEGYYYVTNTLVKTTMDAVTYLINESPVNTLVDSEKIGLIGHSLGSFTDTETAVFDERIDAVVALSQGNILHAKEIDVPVQFQFGCFDITCSFPISFICYKKVQSPKELIAIQAGTHIGFTAAFGKYCLCPPWQKEVCLRYAIGWFDYFLKNKPEAYETITTGSDHLSKIIHSRYDFGEGEHRLQ